jgi:hypothetical protein
MPDSEQFRCPKDLASALRQADRAVERPTPAVGEPPMFGMTTGRHLRRANSQGREPADLPVAQPTKFEPVIHLKTVKTISLNIPASCSRSPAR